MSYRILAPGARALYRLSRPRPASLARLVETRKAVVAGWMGVAASLDAQGEITLAGDVRYFAKHLPPVLTDRERLAAAFVQHLQRQRTSDSAIKEKPMRDRGNEFAP